MSKQNTNRVKQVINNLPNIRNISVIAHIDSGKCFGKGTPILMANGQTKYVEDIKNDEYVMGHNMKSGKVSNYHTGTDKMYLVKQSNDNLTYSVNSQHMMVFQLINDHLIQYNDELNTATLYYFENNKLQIQKREKYNFIDKIFLNIKVGILSVTKSSWLGLKQNNRINNIGSWLYIPVNEYITYPESVKSMLTGVQLDYLHYNTSGEYKYSLSQVTISENGISNYYGFEVPSNPLLMLSDGTIVHNSTLSDSLITKAGFIAADKAGKVCHTDTREDEKERGITIKSCSVSLYHKVSDKVMPYIESKQETNGNEFLINLIDSPGHVDFSSEVTAALRVTDGAVCVVECIGGVSVQTETVVRQSIQENIDLVLMINKMDRAIVEQQLEPEILYQRFNKIIEDMNVLMSVYGGDRYSENYFDPLKGNVVFGAAYHGWGFNIRNFAEMYSRINKMDMNKITKRLWGNYFVNDEGKWSKDESNGKRGFIKLILDPIYMVYGIKLNNDPIEPILEKMTKLEVNVSKDEITDKTNDQILCAIMRNWLPAGDAVLEMVIEHLPSPKKAQKYRGKQLYTGDLDSDVGQAIINCDPNGPMTMFVSKMFPANDNRFYAFGRVFSGTIKNGQKINIMGGNYKYGSKTDLVEGKNIQRVVLMMAKNVEPIDEVPCGNIVGLVGIDQYMTKSGTLSDVDAHPIRPMKYSVSPVVQVAVEPKNVKDMNKLHLAMKRLAKSDPLVQCTTNDCGENIIAGAGELHVEICLHDLRKLAGIEINVSEPVVPYCETILEPSEVCYSRSGSGLNRLLVKAQPVPNKMVNDIDNSVLNLKAPVKELTRTCISEYGFEVQDFKRLWAFGPEEATHTNVFTDESKGVAYLDKVRGSIINSFEAYIGEGVLVGEPLRGVHFKLTDGQIHSDPSHRGADEIMPTMRKAIYGAMISAKPRLVEPVFLCEIYCPTDDVGPIYGFMSQRRGEIISEEPVIGNPMTILKCYLPVAESFGFTDSLRGLTHGRAFPTCVFDHWQVIDSDPYEEDSMAYKLVQKIRKRKGKSVELPDISKFVDKMPKEYSAKYENN
jgi:elongation factor 2